jgi:septal ring factor EnvC (AmiA/AmiB activator)
MLFFSMGGSVTMVRKMATSSSQGESADDLGEENRRFKQLNDDFQQENDMYEAENQEHVLRNAELSEQVETLQGVSDSLREVSIEFETTQEALRREQQNLLECQGRIEQKSRRFQSQLDRMHEEQKAANERLTRMTHGMDDIQELMNHIDQIHSEQDKLTQMGEMAVVFRELDNNMDGWVTREELEDSCLARPHLKHINFDEADKDGDGKLRLGELLNTIADTKTLVKNGQDFTMLFESRIEAMTQALALGAP